VRTTLTLDQDISAKLKAEVRKSGRPFKQVVNDLLRAALNARRERPPTEPFKIRARDLGSLPGLDYDDIADLLEQTEGPVTP
jgi:hypothetical protein